MGKRNNSKLMQSLKQIPGSLLKFPVELLLAITFYVLVLIGLDHLQDYPNLHFENTYYTFIPLFILTYSLNRPGWKWKIPYILSYFLWIPILLYYETPGTEIIVAYFLSMLILLIGKGKTDNAGYARNAVHVVKYFVLSCIIGLVLVVLIYAIVLSVKSLFEGGDAYFKLAGRTALFVGIVLVPMLSCALVGGQEPAEKPSTTLGVFLNYIFTPALLVYTIILYAYMFRILFRWDLPQGGVAYMALAYLGIAMVCYLLGHHIEKHPFRWFYRWFPPISAPIVVLLWVGTLRRVVDYGFTEERVYLVAAVALMTVFDVLLFFTRTRDFRKMTIALGAMAVLLTFIPCISARSLGIQSQKHRLISVLPMVTEDNGLFKAPDYDAIAQNPEWEKTWRKAASAYEYLSRQLDKEEFHEAYGIPAYGSISFSEDCLRQAKAKYDETQTIE